MCVQVVIKKNSSNHLLREIVVKRRSVLPKIEEEMSRHSNAFLEVNILDPCPRRLRHSKHFHVVLFKMCSTR